MAKNNQYSESSITVLKGLEPVKERPGMYTRTDSPTHICQEVIDNAADEALGGFATEIDVQIHEDGSLSVRDNGRGIPVGLHPEEGVPVVELVFTRLHAGGKFNKKDGGSAYAFSGGLHGVGVSVTNALSTRLEVTVKREGKIHRIVFSGGDVIEPLTEVGKCAVKDSGTEVRVWPDGKYFESPNYSIPELERLLRAKAVLLPGVRVSLTRPVKGEDEAYTQTWHYPDGLKSYLTDLIADAQEAVPIFSCENYISDGHNGDFSIGEGAAFALTWLEEGSCANESYVNLIPTPLGGTHEAGLKQAVFNAVNNFINLHNLLPRGVKVQSDDVFGKTAFVLSARVLARVAGVPAYGVCSLDVIARQGLDLLAPDTRVYAIADARRRELYWGSYVAAGPDDVTLEGRLEVGDVSALLGAIRTARGLVVAGAPIPAHSADALARADLGPQVSLDPAVMSRIVATRLSRGEEDRLRTDPLYLRRPDIQGQPTARL